MIHLSQKLPPFLPTAIITAVILYLTLFPDPFQQQEMPSFPHADKLVHAIMMLAWMVSASYDYTRKKRPPLSRLPLRYCIVICLMTILFGGVIEIAQSLMDTGRNADILDFAADALGALAGMLAVPVLMPLLVRH